MIETFGGGFAVGFLVGIVFMVVVAMVWDYLDGDENQGKEN